MRGFEKTCHEKEISDENSNSKFEMDPVYFVVDPNDWTENAGVSVKQKPWQQKPEEWQQATPLAGLLGGRGGRRPKSPTCRVAPFAASRPISRAMSNRLLRDIPL